MTGIRKLIADAIAETGIERPAARKAANRVVKRLGEHDPCVAEWVSEMGVFKFVGYTQKPTASTPAKTISTVQKTRHHVPAYVANEGDE